MLLPSLDVNCQGWQERTWPNLVNADRHQPSCPVQAHTGISIYLFGVALLIIMSRQTRPINEEDQRRSRSPQPDNRSHRESQRTRSPVIKQEKQASPNIQLLPTPDKTPQTSEFTPNSLNHAPASLNHIAPNQLSHTSSQQRSFVAPFEQTPEQPLAIERFLAERNEMATMTMHAAQGHTPAAWDERGARARAGEFQTDAMTLPPIRQVSRIEIKPTKTSLTASRLSRNSSTVQSPRLHVIDQTLLCQPLRARVRHQLFTAQARGKDARSALMRSPSTQVPQPMRSSQCTAPALTQSTLSRSILSHSTTNVFQDMGAHSTLPRSTLTHAPE